MEAVEFNKLLEKCNFEIDSLKHQLNLLKKVAKMEERLSTDALKLLGSTKSSVSIPSGEKFSANVTAITEAKELGFRVRERYASNFIFEVSQSEVKLDSIGARIKKIVKESRRVNDTVVGLKKKVTAERESCMAQWQRLNEELTSSGNKKSKLDKTQSKTSTVFKRLDERVAALNNGEKEGRQHRKDLCGVLSEIFECQRSMVKLTRTEAGDSIAAYSNALGELRVPLTRKVPSQKKLIDHYVSSLLVHNTNLPCTWSDVRQHRKPGDTHSVPKLKPPIDELEPQQRRAKKTENGESSDDSDSEVHVESDAVFVDGLRWNWGDRAAPGILASNHVSDQKSRGRDGGGGGGGGGDADSDRNEASHSDLVDGKGQEEGVRSDMVDLGGEGGSEPSSSTHSSKSRKSTRKRAGAGKSKTQDAGRSPMSKTSVGSDPEPLSIGSGSSILTKATGTRPQLSPKKSRGGASTSSSTTPRDTLSRSQKSSTADGEMDDGTAASWSLASRRKRPNGNPFRPGYKSKSLAANSSAHEPPEGLSPDESKASSPRRENSGVPSTSSSSKDTTKSQAARPSKPKPRKKESKKRDLTKDIDTDEDIDFNEGFNEGFNDSGFNDGFDDDRLSSPPPLALPKPKPKSKSKSKLSLASPARDEKVDPTAEKQESSDFNDPFAGLAIPSADDEFADFGSSFNTQTKEDDDDFAAFSTDWGDFDNM